MKPLNIPNSKASILELNYLHNLERFCTFCSNCVQGLFCGSTKAYSDKNPSTWIMIQKKPMFRIEVGIIVQVMHINFHSFAVNHGLFWEHVGQLSFVKPMSHNTRFWTRFWGTRFWGSPQWLAGHPQPFYEGSQRPLRLRSCGDIGGLCASCLQSAALICTGLHLSANSLHLSANSAHASASSLHISALSCK